MAHATVLDLPATSDLDHHIESWLISQPSPRTRDNYATRLSQWLAWCDELEVHPYQVRRTHVDRWMRHLEEVGQAAATREAKLVAVRSWYCWLVDEGVLEASPAARVRAPRREEHQQPSLTRIEAHKLVTSIQADGTADDRLFVLLAFMSGLRCAEICAADVDDLGASGYHRTLKIRGKGQKLVDIPLPPVMWATIDQVVAGRETGPLVRTPQSRARLCRTSAHRLMDRVCAQASIRRVPPHALRRTAIQLLLADGMPLRQVQLFARHADPRTTARYDNKLRTMDEHASYSMMRVLS